MPKAITLTRELAWAASYDAANARMRKAGRTAWDEEDHAEAVRTLHRLWPPHLEGWPPELCGCPECNPNPSEEA